MGNFGAKITNKGVNTIARKKKPTRKYIPRNEFRYNLSDHAQKHPQYVFGEKNGKFKSIGLTTTYPENVKHYALSKNPNPKKDDPAYLLLIKPTTAHKKYYGKPKKGWSFAKEDMPVVRHRIKAYKKAYNRPPNKKKK